MRHAFPRPALLGAVLFVLFLLGAALSLLPAAPRTGESSPDLRGWTAATYRARKFLVATATTRVERAPAPRWCLPSWWTAPRVVPARLVRVEMTAHLFGGGVGGRTAFSLVGGEGAPGSRGFLVVVPGKKARAVVPGRAGTWWVRTWRADRCGRLGRPRDRRLPGDPPGPGIPDPWSVLADPGALLAARGGEIALLTRKGVARARVRDLGFVGRRLTLLDEDTGTRRSVTVRAARLALEPVEEGGATLFDLEGRTVVEVDPGGGILLRVEGRADDVGSVRVRLVAVSRKPLRLPPPPWPPADPVDGPVDGAPGNP